jgi:uncharacterized protein YjbJ (UPF0337 family)
MNKDTVEGKFDQIAGAIKQKTGEVFGDQKLANSGVADQVKGAAKETWGNAKDVVAERKDEAELRTEDSKLHAENKADNLRDRIVQGAQNLKDKVNEELEDLRNRGQDV